MTDGLETDEQNIVTEAIVAQDFTRMIAARREAGQSMQQKGFGGLIMGSKYQKNVLEAGDQFAAEYLHRASTVHEKALLSPIKRQITRLQGGSR